MSGLLHAPAALTTGEETPGTRWIGGGVDPRAGVLDMEKRKFSTQLGIEPRPFDRPAGGQSLFIHRGSFGQNYLLIYIYMYIF
jgi:hypothetical protein